MTALTQFSYTSVKKFRMASSVARPVGLAPMAVDARAVGAGGTERVVEAAREPVIVEPRGREEVGEVG